MIGETLREFVEAGLEREDAARIADLRDQALRQARRAQRPVGARCRRRRGRDAATGSRRSACPMPGGWPSRWPWPESTRSGSTRCRQLAGPATPAALRSIAASLNAQKLVGELRESTDRMSSLVGAVKAYAYMDRGGVVQADVHEGLETTLTVLAHKLKHTADRGRARLRPHPAAADRSTARSSTRCGPTCSTTRSTPSASRARSPCARGATATASWSTSPTRARDPAGGPRRTYSSRSSPPRTSATAPGLGLDTARRIVEERHGGSLTLRHRRAGHDVPRLDPLPATHPNRTETTA